MMLHCVQVDVIEAQYASLVARIESATDFSELVLAHEVIIIDPFVSEV
jgi:hypothetical protein